MSSAFSTPGSKDVGWPSMSSWYQRSRSPLISTSLPHRRTTMLCSMEGQRASATSVLALRGTTEPRRQAPSWVITTLASASMIRSARASEEKPPNTTLCTAPMRAQASMATGSSGIMPI